MKDSAPLNRQTLLPQADEQSVFKLLELFDLLRELEAEDARIDGPACPLREDAPRTFLPPEELFAYFPVLSERGIQMPGILPPVEEKP